LDLANARLVSEYVITLRRRTQVLVGECVPRSAGSWPESIHCPSRSSNWLAEDCPRRVSAWKYVLLTGTWRIPQVPKTSCPGKRRASPAPSSRCNRADVGDLWVWRRHLEILGAQPCSRYTTEILTCRVLRKVGGAAAPRSPVDRGRRSFTAPSIAAVWRRRRSDLAAGPRHAQPAESRGCAMITPRLRVTVPYSRAVSQLLRIRRGPRP